MTFSLPNFFSKSAKNNAVLPPTAQPINQNEYFATVLSAIKDGIIVVDSLKNITLINRAAEAITGLLTKDAVGKPVTGFFQFFINDQDVSARVFNNILFSEDTRIKITHEQGITEALVKVVCSPMNQNGVHAGWVMAIHDIRFEKQLEEMKFGFVSIAAHELRTPLTTIKGSLSVLISDYKDSLNEDQKNLLSQIGSNTEKLLILVENLLNVSRIERGAIEFAPTAMDWIATVAQIVEDFKQRAIEKNIELTFVKPEGAVSLVRADKVRIGEVLSNLLANAINYTNPHGKVTVMVEAKGSEVWTSVTDTGLGIPKEAMEHLFTKFFRVSKGLTYDQNSHGTGLGLYISKAIVEMHKGRIWVNSELGKGSTFVFALPL